MERIFVKEIKKIGSLKPKIEKALDVKLNFTKTHIEISANNEDGLSEYLAEKVIEAIAMGFSPESAFQLKSEDYMFEKIDIKKHVKQSRVKAVKARLIGRKGKAKSTLENLTECEIEIKGHYIGIIGETTKASFALDALKKMVKGSPHNKVYAYLERNHEQVKLREDEEESLFEEKQ
ncbi:hypothetical protein ACFLZZ_02535 [Nanoarchaeota archaeon]